MRGIKNPIGVKVRGLHSCYKLCHCQQHVSCFTLASGVGAVLCLVVIVWAVSLLRGVRRFMVL
jgi:hypothetical protein